MKDRQLNPSASAIFIKCRVPRRPPDLLFTSKPHSATVPTRSKDQTHSISRNHIHTISRRRLSPVVTQNYYGYTQPHRFTPELDLTVGFLLAPGCTCSCGSSCQCPTGQCTCVSGQFLVSPYVSILLLGLGKQLHLRRKIAEVSS